MVSGRPGEADETTDHAIVVPPGAVFAAESGQQSYVWVVDEKTRRVARREVETGQLTPVGIAITKGLQPGEWVVTAGVNSLRENQEVKIPQEGSR